MEHFRAGGTKVRVADLCGVEEEPQRRNYYCDQQQGSNPSHLSTSAIVPVLSVALLEAALGCGNTEPADYFLW
ncbi:MAG: hypothetical protein WCD43_05840 [Candidatus Acidiferrales bacterium]